MGNLHGVGKLVREKVAEKRKYLAFMEQQQMSGVWEVQAEVTGRCLTMLGL